MSGLFDSTHRGTGSPGYLTNPETIHKPLPFQRALDLLDSALASRRNNPELNKTFPGMGDGAATAVYAVFHIDYVKSLSLEFLSTFSK
jgi:hypothetical protein